VSEPTTPASGGALRDRVVVVTGAARGIGKSLARAASAEGAFVVVADIEFEGATQTAAEIEREGPGSLPVRVDIADGESVRLMVDATMHRFGRVDVLVNNAGMLATLGRKPFDAIDEEEWDRVMTVNVKGAWLCCREVAPAMKDQGYGKIINVSSDTILSGVPGMLHYVASKGALAAMTRSLARELGPHGICVNAIAPGFTTTDAAMARGTEANERNIRIRAIPRAQTPEDITGTVVFLASSASDFLTGQLIAVNGGAVFH
jgi:NAD(P)-dependent dehydrogenase (short-subunit alcohol dehydrogenase family)